MRKGLILIILGVAVMVLCASNAQAATGSSYSSDSILTGTGVSNFHPIYIGTNDNDIKENTVLAKRLIPKKPKKK